MLVESFAAVGLVPQLNQQSVVEISMASVQAFGTAFEVGALVPLTDTFWMTLLLGLMVWMVLPLPSV